MLRKPVDKKETNTCSEYVVQICDCRKKGLSHRGLGIRFWQQKTGLRRSRARWWRWQGRRQAEKEHDFLWRASAIVSHQRNPFTHEIISCTKRISVFCKTLNQRHHKLCSVLHMMMEVRLTL